MGIIAKQPDTDIKYDPVPQGLHVGICYGIFDLGTQHSEFYDTWHRKIIIVWELPEVRGQFEKDGETKDLPKAISNEYTLSLHSKSALRHDLETWRSKGFTEDELSGFDITRLLGVPCQIQVIHKQSKDGTKTYSNVGGIVQAPKGYNKQPENEPIYFSFEEHGQSIPEKTPEWIVNKIKQSKEWRSFDQPSNITPLNEEKDPDVPF